MSEKDKIKNAPPLLGRYRLLKEKHRSPAYRSFLAYDLKLKRGVIVKLIAVQSFHKMHLPALWQFLEKTARDEQCISRVVELDYQKDSILVVEEYLEGRYFNTKILENEHDYERFEIITFRAVDLIRRFHARKIPHGFLDFRNLKVTPDDGVVVEDYPILYWLDSNGHLPQEAIIERRFKPEFRDIRQLGLILFNLYRTQLVPEFHDFPERYSRSDIYDFFRNNSFNHFSDLEKFLARLLLAGEPPKGFMNIKEATENILDFLETKPPPVRIREKTSPLARLERKVEEKSAPPQKRSTERALKSAQKQTKTVPVDEPITKPVAPVTTTEKPSRKKHEIYSKRELSRESIYLRLVAWISTLVMLIVLVLAMLVIVRGFLATSTPEITTPDFAGVSFTNASSQAEQLGLKLTIISEEYSEELPRGMIIEHSPSAGTRTKKGRTMYAVVSKGLAELEVPNVIGMSENAAEEHLASFQLEIGRKEYVQSDDIPLGIVINQNPSAKEKVAAGEKINVTVSAGLLKTRMMMPDLHAMTLAEAKNTLEQRKLRLRRINRTYSAYTDKDMVTSQSPSEGQEVESGSMVDIEVMLPLNLRPEDEFKIAVNIMLPDFDGRKTVRIINRNQRNTVEVHNRLHSGRDEISIMLDGYGRTTISVYLEDELIREEIF